MDRASIINTIVELANEEIETLKRDDLFLSLLRLAFRDLPIPIRAKTASTFLAVTLDNTFAPLVLVPDAGVLQRR